MKPKDAYFSFHYLDIYFNFSILNIIPFFHVDKYENVSILDPYFHAAGEALL